MTFNPTLTINVSATQRSPNPTTSHHLSFSPFPPILTQFLITIFFATFTSQPSTPSPPSHSHIAHTCPSPSYNQNITFFTSLYIGTHTILFSPLLYFFCHISLPKRAELLSAPPPLRRRDDDIMARGHRLLACLGIKGTSVDNKAGPTATTADLSIQEQRRSGPVLVELFSSQGCPTSPVAELLVSRLGRGDFNEMDLPPVVVLAYHVDYWDYMGWKDPYGSSQWTVRQKAYIESLKLDTMFTPQIVVQGQAQCAGNDENALLASIKEAPRYAAPTFQATFQRPTPDSLQVSLTGALRTKADSNGVNVMVALYESGLVTDCPQGENKGRVLSNDYVVRRLEKLCTVKDIAPKKTISGTLTFPLWEGFNATKCGLVLFVQNNSHHNFGAQNFQVPNN